MTDISQAVPPPQSEWKFIDELKQPEKRVFFWTRTGAGKNEIDLRGGVKLVNEFPGSAERLATAVADWENFCGTAKIPTGKGILLRLVQKDAGKYDSFRIIISKNCIEISAGDIEGLRRGIFYLEDLLLAADGPFLKQEEIHRQCWLKNRISRCFYGPIKRPPMNRDELLDDHDYYPDAYLNRLAHEGTNGLWLTVTLKDLARTEFTPDAAPDSERRLAKLRRTVEQCLRYGIKTYLLMIEPISWRADDPVLKKYPELGGAPHADGTYCFCPSSKTAEKYLYDSTYYIFSRVPELGGILNISIGEMTTTCLSSIRWYKRGNLRRVKVKCPRCSKRPLREAIYRSVAAMTRGMRAAAPEAEFLSWYYCSDEAELKPEIYKLNKLPQGATLIFNFETGGRQNQCGREITGGDYWLAYAGPSERYRKMINSLPPGTGRGAKLQVGCAYELSTVPYIPVPGILYRKYKELRKLEVATVMQCWYMGNYPGLMNKAAGMLAFEDFSGGEEAFLMQLARPRWGGNAAEFVRVWQMTSDAYQNYPFSNRIQYYGPFPEGITWPLYPSYQYQPLYPTWRPDFPPSGDMIGECLCDMPLEHAVILSSRISALWHEAAEKALTFRNYYRESPEHLADLNILEALDILFASARNIFLFYLLRSEEKGFTREMQSIMRQEIVLTERLSALCRIDSRLGFHSEAETYRYFPQKLELRKKFLEEMLTDPLPEVTAELHAIDGQWIEADHYRWQLEKSKKMLIIHVRLDQIHRVDQIFAAIQGKPETSPVVIGITKEGNQILTPPGSGMEARQLENEWQVDFQIPWADITLRNGTFRIALTRLFVLENAFEFTPSPPGEVVSRLRIGYHLPQHMITYHM